MARNNSNKCTLIIDGNWLLMSRLGLYMDRFNVEYSQEEKESAQNQLVDFLAKSINVAINRFPSIVDNVLMVQDGGSWRKSLPKPKMYEGESYKGTRKKDVSIDWTYVFGALRVLCGNLKKNDITCICESNVEGDDWAWYWSRYLNRKGTNCIIWTSDCDLKQLVQRDSETLRWTAWFNDRAGLVLPDCYDDSNVDIMEMFMVGTNDDPTISLLRKDTADKYNISYINPYDIINEKIVCGDASDNIKSIIQVQKAKKTSKISANDWKKIKEEYNINTEEDLENQIATIVKDLLSTNKFKGCQYTMKEIGEMFLYNKQLVWLDKTTIPQEIIKSINNHKDDYKLCDIEYLRNNYRVLANETEADLNDVDDFMNNLVE